jgi:hypothetical protein
VDSGILYKNRKDIWQKKSHTPAWPLCLFTIVTSKKINNGMNREERKPFYQQNYVLNMKMLALHTGLIAPLTS